MKIKLSKALKEEFDGQQNRTAQEQKAAAKAAEIFTGQPLHMR